MSGSGSMWLQGLFEHAYNREGRSERVAAVLIANTSAGSGSPPERMRGLLAQGILSKACFFINSKQSHNLGEPLLVVRRQAAARAEHLHDQLQSLLPYFTILGQHLGNCLESGGLVDYKHVELLADHRLEIGERHLAVRFTQTTRHLKSPLIHRAARHSRIEKSADNGLANSAFRDTRLEFGDSLVDELLMHWAGSRFTG